MDSSVALSWAFPDEKTTISQALYVRSAQVQIHVPAIRPFEIGNKLDIGLRKGRSTATELAEILGTFQLLDICVHGPAPLTSLVAATKRFGLLAYDAAFVDLALHENLPLATFDQKMRTAALAAGVTVIP